LIGSEDEDVAARLADLNRRCGAMYSAGPPAAARVFGGAFFDITRRWCKGGCFVVEHEIRRMRAGWRK
jgi:hypothetical protein